MVVLSGGLGGLGGNIFKLDDGFGRYGEGVLIGCERFLVFEGLRSVLGGDEHWTDFVEDLGDLGLNVLGCV